jgi:hypothetical protein
MERRKIKRRKMSWSRRRWMMMSSRIRMRRRIRMNMMAKNIGRLPRERWYIHRLTM